MKDNNLASWCTKSNNFRKTQRKAVTVEVSESEESETRVNHGKEGKALCTMFKPFRESIRMIRKAWWV